ncbi:BZ3500_MvSof-1268-A1-R1_Chr4-2g07168 [Microbotryum saponariae]|uniref:BZ3500_MvSof-1268-A1-R1_Chr4-2g07168 protein n=1 Tax=Microbotryum saponariae TaxID=289078 RepID=A0A2X0KTA7_9BASI|nr:BZ3500_MvSof-1268-A1-R1_Chr4-2g07168 [Microbotryum saponariae]SDA06833.1 BZ3501_MvSof-1269-A2-R1_Chr4-2g06879 [Microbotryum saponariae]
MRSASCLNPLVRLSPRSGFVSTTTTSSSSVRSVAPSHLQLGARRYSRRSTWSSSSTSLPLQLPRLRFPSSASSHLGNSGSFSSSTSFRSFSSTPFTTMVKREPSDRVLTRSSINPAVLKAEYAVRGKIPLRAEELREQLESGDDHKLPFDQVVSCNIGNPQQLDQKPLTYLRQRPGGDSSRSTIAPSAYRAPTATDPSFSDFSQTHSTTLAALTEYPILIDSPEASALFPKDVLARAKKLVEEVGSVGAYSHSMGVPAIRKRIAKFIEERDGYPSSPDKIYITAGASGGVSNLLQVLVASAEDGVLIPIPQYPLYTAALALNSARAVPYYLDESNAWSLDMDDVRNNVQKAREDGTVLKAMVVINPGNPTGNCLSRENMNDILKVCYEEKLVLMADEVYQDNIYHKNRPFISFKKALKDLGAPYSDNVELVSFHSISKGQTGECGRRGGYFELCNFAPEAEEEIYKLASIQLCPSLGGQIGVDVLVCPPKEGEASYAQWIEEREGIAKTLKERSEILHKAFNELEGVECNDAEGALYLFPTVHLPPKAIEAAKKANLAPDAFYCLELLQATGICVVPGSGFGQKEGTFHFRTTFLAPGTDKFAKRLQQFHEGFMKQYRD